MSLAHCEGRVAEAGALLPTCESIIAAGAFLLGRCQGPVRKGAHRPALLGAYAAVTPFIVLPLFPAFFTCVEF
jgi:hypothetical protein